MKPGGARAGRGRLKPVGGTTLLPWPGAGFGVHTCQARHAHTPTMAACMPPPPHEAASPSCKAPVLDSGQRMAPQRPGPVSAGGSDLTAVVWAWPALAAPGAAPSCPRPQGHQGRDPGAGSAGLDGARGPASPWREPSEHPGLRLGCPLAPCFPASHPVPRTDGHTCRLPLPFTGGSREVPSGAVLASASRGQALTGKGARAWGLAHGRLWLSE